jgi:multicomponent K+:H+ antiporter subunit D
LSGFIGKVALMQAAAPVPGGAFFWALLLLAGLFALIALSRAGSTLFWRPRHEPANAAADPVRLGLTLILPALVVALSVRAETVLDAGQRVAAQLHAPDRYIEAVLGSAEGRTK